jgi:hypothetical protein
VTDPIVDDQIRIMQLSGAELLAEVDGALLEFQELMKDLVRVELARIVEDLQSQVRPKVGHQESSEIAKETE